MAQINDPKLAFAYLRPACVLLTRQPSVTNVETLGAQLRDVNDTTLQQLQDYVLFPLRFVLKLPGPRKDTLVQAVAETMAYLLENTCVQSWETLRDLLSELCLCLCSPTDPSKPALSNSEELRGAVLRCLDALLHAAYGDIVFRLFEPTMLPGLGAAISLLLALGEHDKSRGVQAAALKCLEALTLQCDCPQDHVEASGEESLVLGSTLATFLPGITIALARIISGDMRQGHAVTVRALRLWSRMVGLVLADSQLQGARPERQPGPELGRVGELIVQRTEDWVKGTSGRLALLLRKIISCSFAHRHWRMRLELVEMAHQLLANCSVSLGECVGSLLETLVGGVNDEEPRVRERCEAALRGIAGSTQSCRAGQSFSDILSESLHILATSLPRLMRTSDDQRKLFILNVFLGYLKVLGPAVCVVLASAAHLQRVSQALLQILELDVTDVRILEERSQNIAIKTTPEGEFVTHSQRKHFLYFTDKQIFSVLVEICRTLGYHGNIYLLTDHFLDRYRESQACRKQAALVLNELVAGAAGVGAGRGWGGQEEESEERGRPPNMEDLRSVVGAIIEEYTSLANWYLATSQDTDTDREEQHGTSRLFSISSHADRTHLQLQLSNGSGEGPIQLVPGAKTSTVHQLNSNIWQLCLQLEGISSFARTLGPDFSPLLMTSLYAVLEKAGEESVLVSQAALGTMWAVSEACGYGSLGELINANADYLVNDVSLNLQRLALHPQAPRVLSVMFLHSDPSLLPLLGDLVQDVLLALDLSYDHRAPLFCCVLHSLLKALARWFPSTRQGTVEPNRTKMSSWALDVPDMRQFLQDYQRQTQLAEGTWLEEEDADTDVPDASAAMETEMKGPDVKAELEGHLMIAKDVMERCTHLLSHPSLRLRLKVLDILELCVCVLSEKEVELLPMAHRCWPPLLLRLTTDDPLVVLRAFRVLCMLGETCGDFLRTRVSKEVLPKVTTSLTNQALVSARAGPVYSHTLSYKLQLAVLQGLGSLCLRLDLVESDLDSVSEACLPYLSCKQPPKLQEACLSVFRQLIQVDPDALWLTLNELHCPHSYSTPYSDLRPIVLSGQGRPRNEFTDNVLKLLEEFDSTPKHL